METASLLGMCRKTLMKYARQRDIRVDTHPTGKMFFMGSEIRRFYDQTI